MTDGDVQQQIERLNQQVQLLYQQGRYEQVISIATRARDLTRQHLGEDSAAYADSLNSLGLLYREVGDYAEAKSYFEEALGVYSAVVGEDHPVLANVLNNLGSCTTKLPGASLNSIHQIFGRTTIPGQTQYEVLSPLIKLDNTHLVSADRLCTAEVAGSIPASLTQKSDLEAARIGE